MRQAEVARAFGVWLAETWEWSIFFTLTVADHMSGPRKGLPRGVGASERLLHQWAWGSIVQRGGYWIAAMEMHAFRVTPHFHGLAGGFDEEPSRVAMWREYRELTHEGTGADGRELAARAQVVPVNDPLRQAIYIAKYICKGIGKIYSGGELDRRKRDSGGLAGAWLAPTLPPGPSGAGKDSECRSRCDGET